ncbi:xanthine dehydrogenase family protein subunit M [Acidipila sp. EB88]|uniref:FAD binding domain-containing protein n=1 Tax=Acidipila sp. EB88 TaxID=2305226 RepID=UPI000F5E1166|nr:xanthine dehydrogenase family protein subunit M [Acidipila sp. EB88]RRA47220.1 xanthine dehydrogenase family protein subunit M [Acidipila sp. EB88]
MIDFSLTRAGSTEQAIRLGANAKTAQQGALVRFIAGGTTLVDLMKLDVEQPRQVVDINGLALADVVRNPDGSLRIGALVRNADLAHNPEVLRSYPVLSLALLSGASGQLRNMATTSGNLLQRTRCTYFRDTAFPACNKREPGSGCAAIEGNNRINAVLGTSEHCIATHPSDMAVAMTALEARIHVVGLKGERDIAIADFYRVPGTTPNIENVLEPGDLITYVTLPATTPATRSHYLKLRDRASYEFALASAAVVVELDGKRIRKARIALGGVGTKPWRSEEAERVLEGKPAEEAHFKTAAEAAMRAAKPYRENGFKIELARRCIVRALTTVTSEQA